jgi:molybdate transport system substrate-binding protein
MTTGRRIGGVRWWTILLPLALLASACAAADEQDGLTVFAAASLRDVADELALAWEREHPGVPLTVAAEASNVLAAQIAEGAPADVFLSADEVRPQELHEAGLTAAAPDPFVGNRITLVVPRNGARIAAPADLAGVGVRLVAVNRGAPISAYAHETIERLAATMPDPAAFARALTANTVSEEDNVRAALAKVELGEGDAAFVYHTDALSSEAVRQVPLPPGTEVVATYGLARISDRAGAAEFVAWLDGPGARAVLEAAGFVIDP